MINNLNFYFALSCRISLHSSKVTFSVIQFLSFIGGPLDLMSCRVVAAGTQEMAAFIAQQIQTIHYTRDDES